MILEILGKLDNGFHEISSVVQTIDLYDTIIFKQSNHISLKCNIKALENENNLIIKTIKLLKKKYNLDTFGAFIYHIVHRCQLKFLIPNEILGRLGTPYFINPRTF